MKTISDVVAVTRHNPNTHESVVLVAHTAFNQSCANQGNLLRGIDIKIVKDKEFQFFYLHMLLSSQYITQFIRKQNGSKLH